MIYMLEDDSNIRDFVVYALNGSGFEAKGFGHPRDFHEAVAKELPELVILDIMLPEEDGLSILQKLRSDGATADVPVIMLTAKSTEYDKVLGLDMGADDYLSKPFGTMELISRIKALLRRAKGPKLAQEEEYFKAGLYINKAGHFVEVDGRNVSLTLKEFELLKLLFENRGRVLTRDEILNIVWGYDFDGENRTVDVHIRTLRQKLGSAADVIETVRGIGYKIV